MDRRGGNESTRDTLRPVALGELLAALHRTSFRPIQGGRVLVAEKPVPFVAPRLIVRVRASSEKLFASEVVLVNAPAAVGKSTVARYLSACSGVPILDLSKTYVSTDSLVGLLLAGFEGPGDPVSAFHRGELPLIIDALDEGRLLTGEGGFESFLTTTAELLLRDRSVINRPKLVLFGRKTSSTESAEWFSLYENDLACEATLDFFDETEGRLAIEAYGSARKTAKDLHTEPVQRVISAYFDAIEHALSLPQGTLWAEPIGRAFAGYAPVLATLGEALSREANYAALENRIRKTASSQPEAWQVIQDVLDAMLVREGAQFRDKLASRLAVPVPETIYGRLQQLELLLSWLAGPITIQQQDQLPPDAHRAYVEMVEQRLPEHPFVDSESRTQRNAVFGASILAHAIATGTSLEYPADTSLGGIVAHAARQPFLWRCFEAETRAPSLLVDGKILGLILASLWNDPLEVGAQVRIEPQADGTALVKLARSRPVQFSVMPPITLAASAQDLQVLDQEVVNLEGAAAARARSVFVLRGDTRIDCKLLTIHAEELIVEGTTWLGADQTQHSPQLRLHVKPNALYGWSDDLAIRHPWSGFKANRSRPDSLPTHDNLVALLEACVSHLGTTGRPFHVSTSYGAPGAEYEERANWMNRDFTWSFPILVKTLIAHSLASQETDSNRGSTRLRIRVSFNWLDLLDAVRDPSLAKPELRGVCSVLRQRIAP